MKKQGRIISKSSFIPISSAFFYSCCLLRQEERREAGKTKVENVAGSCSCRFRKTKAKRKEGRMAEEKVGTGLFLLYLYFCLQCKNKQGAGHLEMRAAELCMYLRHHYTY